MAEVSLPPGSQLIGKSILELAFRTRYGLNVVGLRRDQAAIEEQLVEEKLRLGDTLLVVGPWKAVRQLQSKPKDFLVLSLPAEIDLVAPARTRAPQALLSLAVMVGLMVSGAVPNVMAALIGCLLMGAGQFLGAQLGSRFAMKQGARIIKPLLVTVSIALAIRLLAERGINEVHTEAGATLAGALLRGGWVDELLLYLAPRLLGAGRGIADFGPLTALADGLALEFKSVETLGADLRVVARVQGRDSF